MFCSRAGFSGTVDLMALFPVRTNPRWRPPPSWWISNGHISATAHDLHRAVIFAIAQLSCFGTRFISNKTKWKRFHCRFCLIDTIRDYSSVDACISWNDLPRLLKVIKYWTSMTNVTADRAQMVSYSIWKCLFSRVRLVAVILYLNKKTEK